MGQSESILSRSCFWIFKISIKLHELWSNSTNSDAMLLNIISWSSALPSLCYFWGKVPKMILKQYIKDPKSL
ncbi:unnamed protein product [Blepharisma stoltei]|uniref:Uncharacterized protein n=1 Tax=Blepharisma stoltei TaxID=1481888 RepID=A0AAU9IG52_9CILI|nr:unnamed protein product [Blepharisma stoltei]